MYKVHLLLTVSGCIVCIGVYLYIYVTVQLKGNGKFYFLSRSSTDGQYCCRVEVEGGVWTLDTVM